MSKISATMVADSLSPQGKRLSTYSIVFPRFILAELNTHRMLSKNSASSRAIPTHKMLEVIKNDPFIPIAWQKEHRGMQGTEYLNNEEKVQMQIEETGEMKEEVGALDLAIATHLAMRDNAVEFAQYQINNKVTKQIANRYLEPFMWHTVLISGTEWENFFQLRCPQYEYKDIVARSWKDLLTRLTQRANETMDMGLDVEVAELKDYTTIERLKLNRGQAEIHMMALAEAMWDAMNQSKPKQLREGEWHLPYGDTLQNGRILAKGTLAARGNPMNIPTPDYLGWETFQAVQIQLCTVMAARVSYTVVGSDQNPLSYERMFAIHDEMATAVPFHASPFEHCARAMSDEEYMYNVKGMAERLYGQDGILLPVEAEGWCRNYRGFIQYRHFLENTHLKL